MDNFIGSGRSRRGYPTKKREKSRVASAKVDRAMEIGRGLLVNLDPARFQRSTSAAASGRFNGAKPSSQASPVDPIDCRPYSGRPVARDLNWKSAGDTQIAIGRVYLGCLSGSIEQINLASLGEGSDLKPHLADSYLPYLDTI